MCLSSAEYPSIVVVKGVELMVRVRLASEW